MEQRRDIENIKPACRLILASASPRRRELLERIGLKPEIHPSTLEENPLCTEPAQVVMELAGQKARDVMAQVREEARTTEIPFPFAVIDDVLGYGFGSRVRVDRDGAGCGDAYPVGHEGFRPPAHSRQCPVVHPVTFAMRNGSPSSSSVQYRLMSVLADSFLVECRTPMPAMTGDWPATSWSRVSFSLEVR